MAVFEYKARNRLGEVVTGTMSAQSADIVGQELVKMGHFPVKIISDTKDQGDDGQDMSAKLSGSWRKKVTTQELVLFTRQMCTLFNAGIPLIGIMGSLGEQMSNKLFRDIVAQLRRDVEGGLSFSEAMKKYPNVFSELYVSMIQAGEAGGVMDEILGRLADLLEKQADTDAKIKAAMQYPKMVVGAMALAVSVLMWKVVPTFITMFEKAKIELPLATKLLIAFNKAFTSYWYFVVLGVVISVISFKKYTATETGRYQWDYLQLKMPLTGPIQLKSSMSKFTRILGTLQKGGVPILDILTVTSRVVENSVLTKIIVDLRGSVQDGLGLAVPLKTSGFVPALVIQMISAGEESGALDDMMLKVADYYDEEVDRAVKSLSSMIEPILLLFMGAMVLFLALAIFMPMWDMSQMTKK